MLSNPVLAVNALRQNVNAVGGRRSSSQLQQAPATAFGLFTPRMKVGLWLNTALAIGWCSADLLLQPCSAQAPKKPSCLKTHDDAVVGSSTYLHHGVGGLEPG